MSLFVVITPFTVTLATAVLEEDQLKFPLPPVACNRYQKTHSHGRYEYWNNITLGWTQYKKGFSLLRIESTEYKIHLKKKINKKKKRRSSTFILY